MRLSADRKSAYYLPKLLPAKVLLDGKEIRFCREASEEAGCVWICRHDENGYLIRDTKTGLPITDQRYGKVEIRTRIDKQQYLRY